MNGLLFYPWVLDYKTLQKPIIFYAALSLMFWSSSYNVLKKVRCLHYELVIKSNPAGPGRQQPAHYKTLENNKIFVATYKVWPKLLSLAKARSIYLCVKWKWDVSFKERILCKFPLGVTSVSLGHPQPSPSSQSPHPGQAMGEYSSKCADRGW